MLSPLVVVLVLAISGSLSIPLDVDRRPHGKLVVFGDSFSDNGNGAWEITNHTWPADPAYYFHRFSNGPVWAEDLAEVLGRGLDDRAIGGATSNNSAAQGFTGRHAAVPVPSALDQVASYLQNNTPSAHDLFVVYIGANDAFFGGNVDAVIKSISSIIYTLREKGVTKFLLGSYPDLGKLPLREFSTTAATQALETFSGSLQQSLLELWNELCDSDIKVGFIDGYALFGDMMSRPSVYGLDPSKLLVSCLVGAYEEAPRTLCSDPDKYIFWDEYHPTRASHKFIAQRALVASESFCDGRDY